MPYKELSPTEQAREELSVVLANGSSCCAHDYVVNAVWAWHLRHAPQPPSRETIIAILKSYRIDEGKYCASINSACSELLALFRSASLSQGSGLKVWCQHCVLAHQPAQEGWGFLNHVGLDMSTWTVCPICLAKRPRPEGGDGA